MFFGIILLIWAGLHAYVLWRLCSVPLIAQHVPPSVLIPLITLLGASYILSRLLEHYGVGVGAFSHALEYIGANWIGIFFLIFVTFFALDVATGFGFLFRGQIPILRTGSLVAAAVLTLISFVQGRRAPTVTEYEVAMPGLSPSADGTLIVVASDLHLGSMNGHAWAKARAAQFASLKPQMILLVGDIFEGEQSTHAGWLPVLRRIQAPLGVFAVTGNHEFSRRPGSRSSSCASGLDIGFYATKVRRRCRGWCLWEWTMLPSGGTAGRNIRRLSSGCSESVRQGRRYFCRIHQFWLRGSAARRETHVVRAYTRRPDMAVQIPGAHGFSAD